MQPPKHIPTMPAVESRGGEGVFCARGVAAVIMKVPSARKLDSSRNRAMLLDVFFVARTTICTIPASSRPFVAKIAKESLLVAYTITST